jgi:excisionase family DNA binding protein
MNEAGLLKGAGEIAVFLGMSVEATKKLIQRGRIPTFKLGHNRYVRASTLLAHLERL